MNFTFRKNAWLAAYDDANDDAGGGAGGTGGGGAGGANGGGAGGGAGGAGGDDNIKDQNHLNAVLKREKEKFRAQQEKQAKQLEEFQRTARLTAEEKDALAQQIEDLRTAHLTEAEQLKRAKDKTEAEYKQKLEGESAKAKGWEQRFTKQKIGYDIRSAATEHGVIPAQVKFLEAFLAPDTQLVEVVGEDGKGTGDYTAMVRFQDKDKDGKSITTKLPIPDVVKRMKELPEDFGYLFQAHTQGGVGGASGQPGKKVDISKMTTEQYIKARKENPSLIYGK